MTPGYKVMIGIPTHNGWATLDTFFATTRAGISAKTEGMRSSLLAHAFNQLVARAVNEGFSHFCLLHADVAPQEDGWLESMLKIMEYREDDVVSLVLPITSRQGNTSTALEAIPHPRKLRAEDLRKLPVTFGRKDCKAVFGNDRLLINTGCMLIKLSSFNPRKTWFEIRDSITVNRDGKLEAQCTPEDWNFSKMLMKNRMKYSATTAIYAHHMGQVPFGNNAGGMEK